MEYWRKAQVLTPKGTSARAAGQDEIGRESAKPSTLGRETARWASLIVIGQ